jgi:hypothetical protein
MFGPILRPIFRPLRSAPPDLVGRREDLVDVRLPLGIHEPAQPGEVVLAELGLECREPGLQRTDVNINSNYLSIKNT